MRLSILKRRTTKTSRWGSRLGTIVQKFGGTSVATAEKILAAARRAVRLREEGHDVAVIVSARGHTTDELIDLAHEIDPDPPARELDMLVATGEQVSIALLAMAIHRLGHRAISLTGGQMGIVTDSIHGKARIREISTARVRQEMAAGRVAIIAGFQGIDSDQNITTLGRGGSDTTAVAVAAALNADLCEIYTDVAGVFTTDPRLVPKARKIDQISYDEMLELASAGAGVMHSRSIEFAKKFGIPIHVRHAATEDEGTVIRPETPVMEHVVVRGAALSKDEARITLRGVPDVPGVVYRVFSTVAAGHIVVDMIVQNIGRDGKAEISFTVPQADILRTLERLQPLMTEWTNAALEHGAAMAKVSVVGLGMRTHTGVADRMFRALAKRGINILMISTSEIKISALVDFERGAEALQAIHEEFELHLPLPEHKESIGFQLRAKDSTTSGMAAEERLRAIARSLPAMEDILVSGVEVDDRQARVTIRDISDRPGVADAVFHAVAAAGVAVDMIVQNAGSDGRAQISFTAPRGDLQKALNALEAIRADLGNVQIVGDDRMVKIAVRGVGMRTHTGVAVRMFEALAAAGVNVQLINTSELHVSVVVDRDQSDAARQALLRSFDLSDRDHLVN